MFNDTRQPSERLNLTGKKRSAKNALQHYAGAAARPFRTTQRYLGKVSDVEAVRWIENLYG
jgi:hypothetical protein